MLMSFSTLSSNESYRCDGPRLSSTTPINSCCDCCYDYHVDIGLLYQQIAFPGMVAGVLYTPVYEEDPDDFQDQTITQLQECFDYTLGLTASLGWFVNHDNWHLTAKFDWLSSYVSNETNVYRAINKFLRPNENFQAQVFQGFPEDFDDLTWVMIDYTAKIDFYQVDVVLSRGGYFSKCFSFEPYAGIKALWFNPRQTATALSDNEYLHDTHNQTIWKEEQNNYGAGPLFGFNGEFYIVKRISFFSDSDISLLYGGSRLSSTSLLTKDVGDEQDDNFPNDQMAVVDNNISCQFYLPVRSIIGLKFVNPSIFDKYDLLFKIGYDTRVVISYPEDERGFAMTGLYTNLSVIY